MCSTLCYGVTSPYYKEHLVSSFRKQRVHLGQVWGQCGKKVSTLKPSGWLFLPLWTLIWDIYLVFSWNQREAFKTSTTLGYNRVRANWWHAKGKRTRTVCITAINLHLHEAYDRIKMYQTIKTGWYLRYQESKTKFPLCSDTVQISCTCQLSQPALCESCSFLTVKTGKLRRIKATESGGKETNSRARNYHYNNVLGHFDQVTELDTG